MLMFLLQVTTNDVVAQDILTYEAVYKVSKLLDQFREGLKTLRIRKLIQAFPEEFAGLFTYTGLEPSDVLDALSIHRDVVLQPGYTIVLSFFHRYIQECNENGKY